MIVSGVSLTIIFAQVIIYEDTLCMKGVKRFTYACYHFKVLVCSQERVWSFLTATSSFIHSNLIFSSRIPVAKVLHKKLSQCTQFKTVLPWNINWPFRNNLAEGDVLTTTPARNITSPEVRSEKVSEKIYSTVNPGKMNVSRFGPAVTHADKQIPDKTSEFQADRPKLQILGLIGVGIATRKSLRRFFHTCTLASRQIESKMDPKVAWRHIVNSKSFGIR